MLPGGSGAAPVAGQGTNEKPDLDTAALDTKIAQTEAKAKMASAKPADKLAAAEAYLDRGNVYMNAGSPRLYKFALADYRRVLRYQPDNQEARQNLDTIVGIYKQLGRPVPELGNEP